MAKIQEISRRCGGGDPLVSIVCVRLSISCFLPKIFAIKSRRRQKKDQCISLQVQFLGGTTPTFYGRLLARFTVRHLANRRNVKVSGPQFFERDDPDFSMANCYHDSLSAVWQSLVEFRLLISVCQAW